MLAGPHIPQSIEDALEVVREILGMDIAYVSRVDPTSQEVLRVVGDSEALGVRRGMVVPIEDTYCDRMLKGRIGNIVRDADAEPQLEGVAGPTAYIGVPLELHDGAVFGTLCAASGRAHPELAERDVRFMQVLARVLAAELERESVRERFAELDQLERDRAQAIDLYRQVLQELVLTRYAIDRRDHESTSMHLERATSRTRDAIEALLPHDIEPGALRSPDEPPG
jgi:GAF domain-containing protein